MSNRRNMFETQVEKEHYFNAKYDKLERFISYYYQAQTAISTNPKTILEIGVGNKTVTNYLKQFGYRVTTADFDESLGVDYVADVRELPMNNKEFDTTLIFEVLEHIPFEDLDKALSELARVSKNYVVVSFPHSCINLELGAKFSLQFWSKKHFVPIRIPYFFIKSSVKRNHQHYWEMGRMDHSKRKVMRKFREYFEVENTFHPPLNQNHFFMVLRPKE
ncbi:MAG: class I SAM-dependent methyltransferase [Candidatus Dojkabacteria bacterium]